MTLPSGKQFAGQNIRVGDIRYWWNDAGDAPNVQINPDTDDGGHVRLLYKADLESGPCWAARPIAGWRPAGIAVEGHLFLFHHHDDYMKNDVYVRANACTAGRIALDNAATAAGMSISKLPADVRDLSDAKLAAAQHDQLAFRYGRGASTCCDS
jgi:hypothetical protein